MSKSTIKLGQKVRDTITGYEGIAIARTTWLYGCERIGVQGSLDKDGKVPEPQWFDEAQLVGLKADKKKPGGPMPVPQRNADPKR